MRTGIIGEPDSAAALAQPVNDTLKRADADLFVAGSIDRHQLYAMQTPQIFDRDLIDDAYRSARLKGSRGDDLLVTRRPGDPFAAQAVLVLGMGPKEELTSVMPPSAISFL